MEFSDVVRRRRMVRSFTGEPVDPEVVRRILDTARRGPSAGFSQGVEFVVVTDPGTRQRIAAPAQEPLEKSGHRNFVAQAPVQVVICVSPEIYRSRYRAPDKMKVRADLDDDTLWAVPYWYTDGGAAMQLLLMAAVDEGIAAAFVGGDAAVLREVLGIPEEYVPIGVALLGHADEGSTPTGNESGRTRRRRPYGEVVHEDRW